MHGLYYSNAVLILSAAATAAVARFRREKLVGREINLAEQLAGVVAGGDAFLIRNAEIKRGNEHLHIPHNLHDGKQAENA